MALIEMTPGSNLKREAAALATNVAINVQELHLQVPISSEKPRPWPRTISMPYYRIYLGSNLKREAAALATANDEYYPFG